MFWLLTMSVGDPAATRQLPFGTKVIISGGITKDGLSKRKVDPCEVGSLIVKANSSVL